MKKYSGAEAHRDILEMKLGQAIPKEYWDKLIYEFNVDLTSSEKDVEDMVAFLMESGLEKKNRLFRKALMEASAESTIRALKHREFVEEARKSILGVVAPLKLNQMVQWIRDQKEKEQGDPIGDLDFLDPEGDYVQLCPVVRGGKLYELRRASRLLARGIFGDTEPDSVAQCTGYILCEETPLICPLTVSIKDPTGQVGVRANFDSVPISLVDMAAAKARKGISQRPGRKLKQRGKAAPKTKQIQAFLAERDGQPRDDNLEEYNRVAEEPYDGTASLYRAQYRCRSGSGDSQRLLAVWRKDTKWLKADLKKLKDEIAPDLRFIDEFD